MLKFSRLHVSGFKSFIDPCELLIEGGVTGIVGPNGCGKSNLVEALRWVMGETSAKQMRGGEMDDVIFAGTSRRPARQIAEVVIEIDNDGQIAPPPWHDVDSLAISRRIERERGSTYRINGREVRARDVQLLFADAATGARSTALVSQGQIGAIIAARPRERRLILEEAAGITGLHSRRHEAELRLRAASTNLERVEDLLGALDGQLRGLKKQARQAARYRSISDQIRKAEAVVLAIRWREAGDEHSDTSNRLRQATAAVTERTAAAASAAAASAESAAALPALRTEAAELSAELQRLKLAEDGLAAETARIEADRLAGRQRVEQTIADLERERALVAEAEVTLQQLEAERERVTARSANDEAGLESAAAELAAATQEVQRLEAGLVEVTRAVAESDARRASLQRTLADLAVRRERLAARRAELDRQCAAFAEDPAASVDLDGLAATTEQARVALDAARTHANASEERRTQSAEALATARSEHQAAEAEATRWSAEEKALQAVLGTPEVGTDRPMVDAVQMPAGFEAALAAALGDDLLAPAGEAGSAHWRELGALDDVPRLPDGAKPLSGFVTAPPALARRLDQVGVIDDAAAGPGLQTRLRAGQRLVSRDGAMWRWDGFTTLPAASGPAARLKQRNRLAEVGAHRETAAAAVTAATAREAEAAETARDAAAVAEAANRDVRACETALETARQAESAARTATERLATQRAAVESAMAATDADLADVDHTRQETEREVSEMPDASAERVKSERIGDELKRWRNLQSERHSARDALARDAEGRRHRLRRIAQDTEAWAARREAAHRQAQGLAERLRAAETELDALAHRPEQIAERRTALFGEIERAEHAGREVGDRLAAAEAQATEADRVARAAESALADAREHRVRAESAVERSEQRLQEVASEASSILGSSAEDLNVAAGLAPDSPVPDRDAAVAKLERLKRERDTIGPVNLCAEQEAAELEAQIQALESERRDLEQAIAKLRHGVAELNREGRKRLLASFGEVDRHFQDLFTRLFGGGRAHLALTESDDPLEAGLEIMASPPGKKLQVMSLLSGGEQALTTLALVFAVFLTHPAPICVLDEVDAPLDDANVDRFCTLVEEMAHASGTRFLVVTHHRMTMARMDRLFGVTMAEAGVSQLVSVDLRQAQALRESA